MKSTLLFLSSLFFVSVNAIEIPDELKQWKCDSSEVRLSKDPIPCLGEFPDKFDIPAIELNLEDLQKIFDGAVSSGGHVVGPMNSPRRARPLGPTYFSMNCKTKVLLDGGKRVSFLSTGSVKLSQTSYFVPFAGVSFKHFLTPINDVDTRYVVPAPRAPQVSFSDLYTEVTYKETTQKYSLKACVQKTDAASGSSEKSCSQTPFELTDENVSTVLTSTLTAPGFHVERTVQVSCNL